MSNETPRRLRDLKAYGPHLGAYKTPAKQNDPRILGPMFTTIKRISSRLGAQCTAFLGRSCVPTGSLVRVLVHR